MTIKMKCVYSLQLQQLLSVNKIHSLNEVQLIAHVSGIWKKKLYERLTVSVLIDIKSLQIIIPIQYVSTAVCFQLQH